MKADNELSLPLGDGERAGFEFSDQPAYYRHKRSEITVIKNQVVTRKWLQWKTLIHKNFIFEK